MIRTYLDVTPAVLKVMEQTTDPRLREIMTALGACLLYAVDGAARGAF